MNFLEVEQEFQNSCLSQNLRFKSEEITLEMTRQDATDKKKCCVVNILKTE